MARGAALHQTAFQPIHDPGMRGVDSGYCTAVMVNGDTVTISDGVAPEVFLVAATAAAYEFPSGATGADSIANLLAEINTGANGGTASALVRARNLKGDSIGIMGIAASGFGALTLATAGTGAFVIGNANFVGQRAAGDSKVVGRRHTMAANEITSIDPAAQASEIMIGMIVEADNVPILTSIEGRDAANDLIDLTNVHVEIVQHIGAGEYGVYLSESGGAAVLNAGDFISWSALVVD